MKIEPIAKTTSSDRESLEQDFETPNFNERVRANQQKLTADLKRHYDFIVCGSGSSGSVVARRLAENPDVSVLLLEAGGTDDVPNVMEAIQWSTNLGSERDWGFVDQPNPRLNGRAIPLNMGKVLGGGSSVNVMAWSRGHKNDWEFFASEAGDPAWNHESVLNIYRRIEDWHGAADPKYRGATSQSSLMNWISPETLGLHKMQARRRIIRMTRGGSSINLMVWSRGQKEPLAILLSSSLQ